MNMPEGIFFEAGSVTSKRESERICHLCTHRRSLTKDLGVLDADSRRFLAGEGVGEEGGE
jgi:hypothetical protein